MFPERSVTVHCDGGKKHKQYIVFLTYSGMLLQCMAIVAKKLRVDADKTAAAFVKEICLLDCCMQHFRKHCLAKHFAISKLNSVL